MRESLSKRKIKIDENAFTEVKMVFDLKYREEMEDEIIYNQAEWR